MSLKIYNGMRIPLDKLPQFTAWFRKRCFVITKGITEQLMDACKETQMRAAVAPMKGLRGKQSITKFLANKENEKYARLVCSMMSFAQMQQQGLQFLNPNCWFNAFIYKKWLLINYSAPFDMPIKNKPKYIEEYGYWTNSDPDERVTAKEWKARGVAWNKVTDDHNEYRLSHTVIDCDKIYRNRGLDVVCGMILKDSPNIGFHCPAWVAHSRITEELKVKRETKKKVKRTKTKTTKQK